MQIRIVTMSLLCTMVGCGSDDDDPGTPPLTPAIVSTVPADGATRVSVIRPLSVQANRDLDLATVNAQTVTMHEAGRLIAAVGVVGLDGTKTVTFQPDPALKYGQDYELVVDGVKGANGVALPRVTVSFSTYVNGLTRYVSHTEGDSADITSYCDYTLDSEGHPEIQALYNDAGINGTWLDSDDLVQSYWKTSWLDATTYRRETVTGAGTDTVWFTADDVLGSYSIAEHGPAGRLRSASFTAGVDMIPFNGDDEAASVTLYTYTSTDQLASSANGNAGPDKIPYNGDDVTDSMWTYVYVAGVLDHRLNANDPGPDTAWGTGDDVIVRAEKYEHDARGLQTKWISHSDPGTDGAFFTDDDVINQYWSFAYDTAGILVDLRGITDAGLDAEWSTADDVIAWRYTFDIDSNGNRITRTRWSNPGPDTDWTNGNELADYYEEFDTVN